MCQTLLLISSQTKWRYSKRAENWKVTFDTGSDTMTGGRLKRVANFLDQEEQFCFTYGDGVSDVNISDLIKFHHSRISWQQ